ncbi:hypothetical protein FGF1_40450 [Flavobacteriaceae bacterium GF1]
MQRFNFPNNLMMAFNEAVLLYEKDANVFAIDIGFRYDGAQRLDEQCVRVHLNFNSGYSSVNDLIYFFDYTNHSNHWRRKVIPLNSERRQKRATLQPGISIGTFTSGTLGLICYDRLGNNRPCLLTAEHVVEGNIGAIVSQPGAGLDRGRFFVDGIGKKLRSDPNGDAAIAVLRGNRPFIHTQFETDKAIVGVREVSLGDILIKSGRTTGLTEAMVDGIGVYYKKMKFSRRAIKGFRLVPVDDLNTNDIQISDNGDSGSIWFDPSTNEGLGLLFSGEGSRAQPHHEFSVAQHLSDILVNLHITLTKN